MKKNIPSAIERTFSELSGVNFWEKNLNSFFMSTNGEFVKEFSPFKCSQDLVGMNDFDFFDETSSSFLSKSG
jgi:hypothetical protein